MISKRIIFRYPRRAIVAAMMLLASCGQSQAEKTCAASIRKGLINPETAEFHDFSKISNDAFGSQYADQLASKYEGMAATAVRDETKSGFNRKMEGFKTASFYTVRVRADGELGNKITKKMLCTLIEDGCVCV